MVWLVFLLPFAMAAALPARNSPDQQDNKNNVSSGNNNDNNNNRCVEENESWECWLLSGTNYMSSLLGNNNNRSSEEARFMQEGSHLLDSIFSSLNDKELERTWRINRRTVVPLVVGVTLKALSVIPLILGKLTVIGGIAIMASMLSLFLSLIMALKKFFGGGGFISLNPLGYHSHGGHYDQGHGGHHRRETYIIRGRDIDQENAIEGINKWEEEVGERRKRKRGPQLPRPETYLEPITNDPYQDDRK